MKVPPRGNFWLPFPALLKIRILCTFFQTSRNINQHQLRLLTPVSCHELCFSDEKQSLSDRYRGSYRGDWKFPVICLSESPSYYIFFCPKWQVQHDKDSDTGASGTFQSTSVTSGIYTPRQILVLGTLQLTGHQPVHPGGQSRAAFPILVTADQTLSALWVHHGASPARLFPCQS